MNTRAVFRRILEAALAAVDAEQTVHAALRLDGTRLSVGQRTLDLAAFRRVIVVGAGKASAPMAAAVERVLAPARVPIEGIVSVRYGHLAATEHVQVLEAAHPIPDAAGLRNSRAIAELLRDADEHDLVMCVLSGGGSALLTLPATGVGLEGLQWVTANLLQRGATIHELNAVRKHLDLVKGGGLVRLAWPARVLTLAVSDVVGDSLDVIASGPTVPDSSTWHDGAEVLRRYELLEAAPGAIAHRMARGERGGLPETPKPGDALFTHASTHVVASNSDACAAATHEARNLGLGALLLTTYVQGEARQVGQVLGSVLREVAASGQPVKRPCCLVAGGETTVLVRGEGLGGRNQEVALGAASTLAGLESVLLAAVGTDGSDGPTDAAGALVDGSTLERAGALQLAAGTFLAHNNAYRYFQPLGDLVHTGPTRTNVNDLYLLLAL